MSGPSDIETGQWMTKAELAQVRGIAIESVEKLMRRQGWRRQPGNDGRIRVLVPSDFLEPRASDEDAEEAESPSDIESPRDKSHEIMVLEAAVAALSEAREEAVTRALAAEQRADGAWALADQVLAQLADERARGERVEALLVGEQQRADALQTELRKAQGAVEVAVERANPLARADQAAEALRADNAEQEVEAERSRADGLWSKLETAQAELRAAQETAEQLRQAEAERQARGLLARIRAALRGG
jgi:hypothetical protein